MIYTDKKELVKLISYMATFDGGLYLPSPRKDKPNIFSNAQFIINMCAENEDYLMWVKDVIENVTGVREYKRKDYNVDGCNRKPQIRLESNRHPFLTTIRDRIYIDNHKVIDPHMLKLMDAEALAIIFMTDGGSALDMRHKNPSASIVLHTKAFSYNDNMALSKSIYEKLGIRSTINRQSKYYHLRVNTADIVLFVNTILPYMKKSFMYKLERIAPYIEYKGGDIVWSTQKCVEGIRNEYPDENTHQ